MRAPVLIRAALSLLLSLGVLTGCATQQRMVYDKAGTTAAARQQDEDQCVRSSITQDTEGRILMLFDVDRNAYARCMQGRGYTTQPAR